MTGYPQEIFPALFPAWWRVDTSVQRLSGDTNMRLCLALCSVLLVSACDFIPRGAGLKNEVLAAASDNNPATVPDFSVEPVTRGNIATYVSWPDPDPAHFHWVNRVDQPNTRTIRSGDTLRVTVWTTENDGLLTGPGQRSVTLPDARVSAGGSVFLPYIGNLGVRGLSPDSARSRIESRYMEALPSAQVQVEMIEGRQATISLIGGVNSPGTYPMPDNDFTVLGLIADGGGVRDSLNNPQVRLQRGSRTYGISFSRLLSQTRFDTTLSSGDKVFVEADDRKFLSLGAAGREAVHLFPSDHLTALEALSIIGGVAEDRADAQGILVLRRYPTSMVTSDRSGPDHPRTVFTIDLTSADGLFSAGQFLIQPDDLIYVSESPVTAAGSILAILGAVRLF